MQTTEMLLLAVGLFFALEGVLYAASPGLMKQAMRWALDLSENQLRVSGLGALAFGVFLVWLAQG